MRSKKPTKKYIPRPDGRILFKKVRCAETPPDFLKFETLDSSESRAFLLRITSFADLKAHEIDCNASIVLRRAQLLALRVEINRALGEDVEVHSEP